MQKKSKTKKIVKSKKKVPLAFKADRLKSRVLIEALNDDSEIDEYMEKTPQPDIDSVADSNVENSGSESEEELDEEALAEKHKRDLNKLKETDPEFYKFLQVKSLQSFHDFTFFTVTCGPKVWDGHTLSYFFYSICTVLHSNNLTLCLQDNDQKLLQFSLSDDEPEDNQEDPEEPIHKPTDDFEVASDESDFEVSTQASIFFQLLLQPAF